MKTRKPRKARNLEPRKARNLAAKALHECKLFRPQTVPAKKGKGTIYKREKYRDRGDHSGPLLFWASVYESYCALIW